MTPLTADLTRALVMVHDTRNNTPEFEVGDRVRVVNAQSIYAGKEGIIKSTAKRGVFSDLVDVELEGEESVLAFHKYEISHQ